jgi:hypothetical protein
VSKKDKETVVSSATTWTKADFLPHMPTLKRDREAMDDEGARKKIKTSSVDEAHTIHPIMDLTADEPQTRPGAPVPPSQELQV